MRPVEILLAEDHEPDVVLTQRAFKKALVQNTLHITRDGADALEFLRREGRWASAPRPDMILLDLNMPRVDGWAVLQEMQKDPSLSKIPVIVMTTSDAGPDIERAYRDGANAYVVKPFGLEGFAKAVAKIEGFWFCLVKLP